MIEARGLTKRSGQVVAVADLTFSVRPGEVTGFLGRNGAGKPACGSRCGPFRPAAASWPAACGISGGIEPDMSPNAAMNRRQQRTAGRDRVYLVPARGR
jgi:ABC-type dipeptide/oligopeptide/nickel transport system ATPase component